MVTEIANEQFMECRCRCILLFPGSTADTAAEKQIQSQVLFTAQPRHAYNH